MYYFLYKGQVFISDDAAVNNFCDYYGMKRITETEALARKRWAKPMAYYVEAYAKVKTKTLTLQEKIQWAIFATIERYIGGA